MIRLPNHGLVLNSSQHETGSERGGVASAEGTTDVHWFFVKALIVNVFDLNVADKMKARTKENGQKVLADKDMLILYDAV